MRTRVCIGFLMIGVVFAFARCGGGEAKSDPRLAPAQPNKSSPLASPCGCWTQNCSKSAAVG